MDSKDSKVVETLEKLKFRGKIISKASHDTFTALLLSLPAIQEIAFNSLMLDEILSSKSPFIYLNNEERKLLKSTSKFVEINGIEKEVISKKDKDSHHMMLILEGEVFAIDPKNNYCEVLKEGDSFGADACLFGETAYSVITASYMVKIMMIPTATFFQLLNCEKQFTLILGRNLLYKQKIFNALENFMSFTADAANLGQVNLDKLIKIYKKINSSLHPGRKSPKLDIAAWKYAIQRLPDNLTNTFIYHLTTAMPDILQNDERIVEIITKARKRTVYKTLYGKNVIILRDMESDLNDLLSNLCVHYCEAKKLRRKLKLPTVLAEMIQKESLDSLPLSLEEITGLSEMWKEKAIENIRNIILHHEDFRIIIGSSPANLRSGPSERWTEALWTGCQKALGSCDSVSEAMKKGLVVDVVQGSTRTLLNVISPYFRVYKDKIMKWFERSGIKLKTNEFFKDTDKLFAAAYYYFKKFPEQEEVRKGMDEEAGIVNIEDTGMTGVKVLIVNVHKLKFKQIPSKSEYHLIINIGYTFGKQGYDIIKCFNLLFDNCIDSFSFIGKAGGLVGERKDILISTKFHDMGTKSITLVNPIGIKQKFFEDLGIKVHRGPMLTVAGTILQNRRLLTYYKHIEGCVGLEMEGCYFAQAIQQGIEMSLLKETVPTRFLYYVSDLPLDPNSNLAQEEGNVSWDEGVPTMNAITEMCLKLCGEVSYVTLKDRAMKFIESHQNIAMVQKEWELAQMLLDSGFAVVAFVNSNEEQPVLKGNFVTVDYNENYEYFLKIESIIKDGKTEGRGPLIAVLTDPEESEFWVPSKVSNNNKIRYNTIKVAKSYKNFKGKNVKSVLFSNEYSKDLEGVLLSIRKTTAGYETIKENECKQIFPVEICRILQQELKDE